MRLDVQEELLDLAEAVTPLPRTVVELATAIASDDVSIKQVVAIVKSDPSLTAKLLQAANSAAVAPASGVTSVEQTVVLLGLARVLSVAVTGSMGSISDTQLAGYAIDADMLWEHAAMSSRVAELIQRRAKVEVGPEVVTAALLHDLGKVVLGQVLNAGHLQFARNDVIDLCQAERDLIGLDHAETGALLLELWNIPDSIAQAIRFHHRPSETELPAAQVVYVADAVAWEVAGIPSDTDPEELATALDALGLDKDELVSAIEAALMAERGDDDADASQLRRRETDS
ncbi:MAG: HDOD domain-containing protein [Actinomycetota bacterium]